MRKRLFPILLIFAIPLGIAASKASFITTNFTSGELSPLMKGRIDVSKYANGAETITNFIPTQFGSLARTPGTEFIGEVRDSTERARLIPFEFSTIQTYILEFNDAFIRFYRNKSRIVESSVSISGITNADPGVVTATSHGYSDGDWVVIDDVQGMTEVNGKVFVVANKNANDFELTDVAGDNVDTTNFGVYTTDSDTKLLTHMNLDFSDSSASEHTPTSNGDVQIDTSQSKFGGASGLFDGVGDYVSYPDSADWDFGTSDFTIELQARFSTTSHGQTLVSQWDTTGNQRAWFLIWTTSNGLRLSVTEDGSTITSYDFSWTPSADTWYHIAIARDGTDLRAFIDGTQIGSTETSSDNIFDSTATLRIGFAESNPGSANEGWIDEVRVSNGTARYTADFTAPTSQHGGNGTSSKIYEIAQTYDESDLGDIQFAQTADIMYLVHPEYAPRKLSRTGHTSWTLETVDFVRGPFLADNTTAVTLNPSAATGDNITITASSATFESGHVGSLWKIKDGVVKIDTFTSSTSVDGDVQDEPDGTSGNLGTTSAVTDWAEGAWSDVQGYPSSVQFYEQRLVFAGSTEQPQTIWLSNSEEFENFDVDDASATDAMTYTIATEQVNAIQWLSAGRVLLMGTSGSVFSLSSGADDDAITPSNVLVKRETTYGSMNIAPQKIGNFNYYIQSDERTMRELSFSFEIDAHKATNISLLSEHLLKEGVKEMEYQQSPHNLLWLVLDDGNIATLTREIDQEVAAWASQTTDGSYENVAAIQTAIPTEGDEVWFVVNRTIDGTAKRYVELLKPFDWGSDDTDQFFVHSGLTYNGASTTTLSGLDHLEGESVVTWGGDATETLTVSGGSITLATAVTKAHVGLPYTSTLVTLPLEIQTQIGTGQRSRMRINNAILRLLNTRSIKVGLEDDTKDQGLTTVFTGDHETHLDFGWDFGQQLEVECSEANNCHLLAIIYQLLQQSR